MFSRCGVSKLICAAISIFSCFVTFAAAQEKPLESAPGTAEKVGSSRSGSLPKTAVQALPRGVVVFDGVRFKSSLNNIIGTRSARAGGSYSGAVSNVPLGKVGRKIHVLHTADHGPSEHGEFIWRLLLTYRNGEQRFFDFAYGVHCLNWWRRPNDAITDITDKDSVATWTGHSVESDERGAELQVFRSTLRNPLPDEEVVRADYITMFGPSSAYVFGVSITDEGPDLRSQDERNETGSSIAFTLMNNAGKPVPNTSLRFEARADDFAIRFIELRCDHHGRFEFPLPRLPILALRYTVRNDSGATRSGAIAFSGGNREPREETIYFDAR